MRSRARTRWPFCQLRHRRGWHRLREAFEYDLARIPGTKLIPLAQVVARMNEIDPSRETVVHCKAGVRSAKAISALKQAGFPGRLINLKGGITAWSDEVDPTVAKY